MSDSRLVENKSTTSFILHSTRFMSILDIITALQPLEESQCLNLDKIKDLILKNMPCARKIIDALLLLNEANIVITYDLISKLSDYGYYAEDTAKALILLNEFDIFLTVLNINTIIEAGPKARELATTVIWFTLNTTSPITILSTLINALATADNIIDSAVALAALSYIIPLQNKTIQIIAGTKDPRHVVNALLYLNKDHVKLTSKRILSIACAEGESIDQMAGKISHENFKENIRLTMQDCRALLNKASHIPLFKSPKNINREQPVNTPFHPRGRTPASFAKQ